MTKKTAGFTILEILIASMIFTVVLLICMQSVIRIGNLYYKVVTTNQIQEVTRQLAGDIAQQIQFGSQTPIPNNILGADPSVPVIFCAGDFRYRIVMNRSLGAPGVNTVLRRRPLAGAACDLTDSNWGGATELAPRRMRIMKFSIQRSVTDPYLWTIDLRVGLGEDNMFTNLPNDSPAVYNIANCKGESGTQFCATAQFQTTILRRVKVE